MPRPPPQFTIKQALSQAQKAVDRGNTTSAVNLYGFVLHRQPNHPTAQEALRRLQNQSQPSAARASMTEPPGDRLRALFDLYHAGQTAQAEKACREVLQIWPDTWMAWNVLGMARQARGKPAEALEAFERAIQHNPDSVDAWNNRGIALEELERAKEALESYDEAIRLAPDHADAHSGRGSALLELGRVEEALESCDRAIRLAPDHADAYSNRAGILKTTGQLEEAIRDCEKALALDPDLAGVYGALGAMKEFQPGDPRIERMEALLARPNLREADRRLLCFALADAYEGLGDYDKSFQRLEEGNRLRKKELDYTIEKDKKIDARVRDIFHTRDRMPTAPPGEQAPIRPIFIVGMPRSGTSLVEQILASHSKVHGAGELGTITQLVDKIPPGEPNGEDSGEKAHPLPKVAVDIVRNGYLEALTGLNVQETIVTDKMPLNFRWIGFILAAFPEARIIHTNRDALAICWSNYKHNFKGKGLGYAYDLRDLAEFYGMYRDLMAFWRERYPDAIYDLSYEKLTENQEEETRKLLAFCALEWEAQCLAFHKTQRPVQTASAVQVRKRMYQGSSEAWRNYEKHMGPLITALEASASPGNAASDERRSGDADAPMDASPKPGRQCGPCTGCCDGWVRMEIGDEPVHPGRPCPHSTGEGCRIYAERPADPCRDFDCGWIIEDSPLPDWMRPDLGKAIVLFGKLDWNGYPVDLAVPVGERIPPRSLEWLEEFSRKHKRPLVYTEQVVKGGQFQQAQKVFGYGPPDFQQDLLRWQQEGRKLW